MRVWKLDRERFLGLSVPSSGSAPTITVGSRNAVNYQESNCDPPTLQSASNSNNSPVYAAVPDEEATNNSRIQSEHTENVFSTCRAASAENQHVLLPWTANSSPSQRDHFVETRNRNHMSGTSLSSSSALSIDDQSQFYGFHTRQGDMLSKHGQPHVIALYNFDTGVEGDLEFKAGDIIMLEDVVDESWYRGRSVRTGAVGIFPMNHVEVRIPLNVGLFTHAQPKIQPKSMNVQRLFWEKLNSTNSMKFPKNERNAFSKPSTPSTLPKRPPRVRVASLRAKHDSLTQNSNSSNNSTAILDPKVNEIVSVTRGKQVSSRFASPLNFNGTNLNNSLPNRLQLCSKPVPPVAETLNQQPTMSSIVSTLKPRCSSSVARIAKSLNKQAIIPHRCKPLPFGVKPLYPGSHPALPTSNDRLKSINGTSNDEVLQSKYTSEKSNNHQSSEMAETLLSKLLPEINRINLANKHNSTDTNVGYTAAMANTTLSPSSSTREHSSNNNHPLEYNTVIDAHNQTKTTNTCVNNKIRRASNNSQETTKMNGPVMYKVKTIANYLSARTNVTNQRSSSDGILHKFGEAVTTDDKREQISPVALDQKTTYHTTSSGVTINHPHLNSDESNIVVDNWFLVKSRQHIAHSSQLAVNIGDVVKCIDPNPSGTNLQDIQTTQQDKWIMCETWTGNEGLISTTHLQLIIDQNQLHRLMSKRPRARVLYKFSQETPDDLALNPGDIIYLFGAIDENWYRGESSTTKQRGMFPVAFVHIIQPL